MPSLLPGSHLNNSLFDSVTVQTNGLKLLLHAKLFLIILHFPLPYTIYYSLFSMTMLTVFAGYCTNIIIKSILFSLRSGSVWTNSIVNLFLQRELFLFSNLKINTTSSETLPDNLLQSTSRFTESYSLFYFLSADALITIHFIKFVSNWKYTARKYIYCFLSLIIFILSSVK